VQVSLAGSRPVAPADVIPMVKALSGDLRRTLATLQFACLVQPGAGALYGLAMGLDPGHAATTPADLVGSPHTQTLGRACSTLEVLMRGHHDVAWTAVQAALAPRKEDTEAHAAGHVSAIAAFLETMSLANAYIHVTSYAADLWSDSIRGGGADGDAADDAGPGDEEGYMAAGVLCEAAVRDHTDAELRACHDALAVHALSRRMCIEGSMPRTFPVFGEAGAGAGRWLGQYQAVEEVVPAAARIWRRGVAMEYAPLLRGMHESEEIRAAHNTKRRHGMHVQPPSPNKLMAHMLCLPGTVRTAEGSHHAHGL
jgi:hypothetical protein